MGKLLTAEQAAEILRFSVQHTKKLLREEKLPGYIVGQCWRVDEDELYQWLQARKNIKKK
jgi:excisionase family DNA binding protein